MKIFVSILLACLLCSFLCAQEKDSIVLNAPLRFSWKQTIVPAGLVFTGWISNSLSQGSIKNTIAEERNRHLSGFNTHADDYLQFSPIVMAYGLDILGIPSRTDFPNRTAILLKTELLMITSVTLLKTTFHTLRPDSSDYRSFPSGHTAQAFAVACFLSEEYGKHYKWMPYLSYGVASIVGALRIANNKHYLSDVLVAAGIGILSTKIVYWTHRYKWGGRRKKSVNFQ